MTARNANKIETYAVLLVGGKGERFWPLSTPERPKQFLKLFTKRTMVEDTVERISPMIPKSHILFVLPPHLVTTLKKELKWVRDTNLVVESEGRNTAPALALAARALKSKPHAVLAVLPSDHLIAPKKVFQKDLEKASKLALKGYLVTFGIKPSRPETGYGYIEIDKNNILPYGGFRVKRFREKPDAGTAKRYLEAGNFLWNSGMFVWTVGSIIEAFKNYHSGIYNALLAPGSGFPSKKAYSKLESISIDYAVMERARNVALVPARFSWDDVGSWTAIERHMKRGLDKNVNIGRLIIEDSEGCIAVAEDGEIALLGVRDLVVVKTRNTVLVCEKNRAAEIKKLTDRRNRLKKPSEVHK